MRCDDPTVDPPHKLDISSNPYHPAIEKVEYGFLLSPLIGSMESRSGVHGFRCKLNDKI